VKRLGGPADHARLEKLTTTLQPDDPINIQFTSGTTGSPKAATLTHHNILNNAFFQGQRLGVVEGDRYCMPLPLYHCGGMVCGSLLGIVHGLTVIYPGEGFDTLRYCTHSRTNAATCLPLCQPCSSPC
jgi:fatty-acyl-CoA synthase